MIRYDTPIVKTADEMKPGDIFRTEYGDVGNWCELVFVCCGACAYDDFAEMVDLKGTGLDNEYDPDA